MSATYFCPACHGACVVSVAFQGRITSNDPADWRDENCVECDARGWIEAAPGRTELRPYTISTRKHHTHGTDFLTTLAYWRARFAKALDAEERAYARRLHDLVLANACDATELPA